jgi:YebC/PmpR family DNA-binding regulatory protein
MSGHNKWASIKHKKAATDAKRGAAFTKIIREITAAAKAGGGNSDKNPRLRTAIQRAKVINMPSNNIDNAIKKGTGELPGVIYETATFDAYGPGGVAILIESLTDNKNRTTAEIRNILTQKNGNMAGAGSTAWMFTKKGYITVVKSKISEEELMGIVLEAGAEDFKSEGEYYEITCEPAQFEAVKTAIQKKDISPQAAEITMIPNSTVKLRGQEAKQVLALMETLEDHEDVQAVYAKFDIPDEEMENAAQLN